MHSAPGDLGVAPPAVVVGGDIISAGVGDRDPPFRTADNFAAYLCGYHRFCKVIVKAQIGNIAKVADILPVKAREYFLCGDTVEYLTVLRISGRFVKLRRPVGLIYIVGVFVCACDYTLGITSDKFTFAGTLCEPCQQQGHYKRAAR